MREKVGYDYRLSAILGRLQRSIRQGDHAPDFIVPHVDLCRLNYLYNAARLHVSRSYRRANLNLEHGHRERVPRDVFVGPHNVEICVICPFDRPCYYVSTTLASEEGLYMSRLLPVPARSIVYNYSSLALDGEFRTVIFTVARANLAVCTALLLSYLACDGISETININNPLALFSDCLVRIEAGLTYLVNEMDICSIVHGFDFDTAKSVFCLAHDACNWSEQGLVCRHKSLTSFWISLNGLAWAPRYRQCSCQGRRS